MKRLLITAILAIFVLNINSLVRAESIEEYKCDLMMKGYEFDNNGLSEAIIKKDREAVELFVKADININLTDNEGYSALDRAIKVNDKDTVLLLSLAGGQTKKYSEISDYSENVEAIKKPSIETTKITNQKAEEPQNLQENKLNSLCDAVNQNDLDMVAVTAKKSIYLNTLTHEGLAPLHYAIFNDNPSMVHLLLNLGADVNILTDDGLTPLDIAVLNNQSIIAKELLESGGALSVNVAKELIKFGCNAEYDPDFGLYDASYEDIFSTMKKIQSKIEK